MNREEQFVITISRQFGTGGHEIGAELARRLGVKLLDKQILEAVARKFAIESQKDNAAQKSDRAPAERKKDRKAERKKDRNSADPESDQEADGL